MEREERVNQLLHDINSYDKIKDQDLDIDEERLYKLLDDLNIWSNNYIDNLINAKVNPLEFYIILYVFVNYIYP